VRRRLRLAVNVLHSIGLPFGLAHMLVALMFRISFSAANCPAGAEPERGLSRNQPSQLRRGRASPHIRRQSHSEMRSIWVIARLRLPICAHCQTQRTHQILRRERPRVSVAQRHAQTESFALTPEYNRFPSRVGSPEQVSNYTGAMSTTSVSSMATARMSAA
jgi:hypothetical protein